MVIVLSRSKKMSHRNQFSFFEITRYIGAFCGEKAHYCGFELLLMLRKEIKMSLPFTDNKL